ncbi:MAG: 3-isopropylmalate dehydratase large subunit [Phototrophicales bacterium]|nr:MAG: 3-isopropylmalate dehydratase large subunit [Phototrophicales bacterium]
MLARNARRASVRPGDLLTIRPDVILSHDNTAAINQIFERLPHQQIKYPERLAITLDHAAPPPTERHAINHAETRAFVERHGIEQFFEVGRGICHQVFCEEGVVGPGMILLGADSHSTHYGWLGAFGAGVGRSEVAALWATGELWLRVPETMRITLTGALQTGVMTKDFALHLIGELSSEGASYMAVEFDGLGVSTMCAESRMVLPNMMAEMGAKNAYMAPDILTWRWLEQQLDRTNPATAQERLEDFRERALYPDDDANYSAEYEIDLGVIEPVVSCPHAVDNTTRLSQLPYIPIDFAFIGTCTNGRLADIAAAADIVRGQRLQARLLVIPASSRVLLDAMDAGYIATLLEAGATIGTPGCGPCMGNHLGVLAPGEVCISSANRNFKGRMGQRDAEIYLANPAVVAASAVAGYITHPATITA